MAVQLKGDILDKLKVAGYNTNRLKKEKILGQSTIQKIRQGDVLLPSYIDTICKLLNCQPGDILEYVQDETIQSPAQ
jgi:putative transcriptional regulator